MLAVCSLARSRRKIAPRGWGGAGEKEEAKKEEEEEEEEAVFTCDSVTNEDLPIA